MGRAELSPPAGHLQHVLSRTYVKISNRLSRQTISGHARYVRSHALWARVRARRTQRAPSPNGSRAPYGRSWCLGFDDRGLQFHDAECVGHQVRAVRSRDLGRPGRRPQVLGVQVVRAPQRRRQPRRIEFRVRPAVTARGHVGNGDRGQGVGDVREAGLRHLHVRIRGSVKHGHGKTHGGVVLDPIPHVHDPERDGGVAVAAVPIVVLSVPDAVDLNIVCAYRRFFEQCGLGHPITEPVQHLVRPQVRIYFESEAEVIGPVRDSCARGRGARGEGCGGGACGGG
mmetsp:Transcript_107704/g.182128  ORF Transcript_107704/g.182128 Transcript_107704/m.182128 type:complete len:284 (-) Transcript_107704:1404-2255(-)